ncbi:unnamed protein product [Closterium sp. Yama58-4]|nr:unnamed protein product [Closterium sp. Yama58-4]
MNSGITEQANEWLTREWDEEAKPMQLLRPSPNHDRLEVVQSTLDVLERIQQPVAFVAVVGPYHGGKSFLLNVLLNSTRGFPVGTRPDPETLGLWVRVVPPKRLQARDGAVVVLVDSEGLYGDVGNGDKDGAVVVLVDSEGLYGEGASRAYDAKLFAVATLLSSYLIYNTLRTLGKEVHHGNQHLQGRGWMGVMVIDGMAVHVVLPALRLQAQDRAVVVLVDLEGLYGEGASMAYDAKLFAGYTAVRYLAAHARTGDQSLETLFTQGIACLTVRTPTDINRLREEVGGAGLGAADVELMPALHPGYLADVAAVRGRVIGGLEAKGPAGQKFTGETVARLLPLLVHFVNSDFPLNAERHIQQVMLDLLLDGAFASAVHFFRLHADAALDRFTRATRAAASASAAATTGAGAAVDGIGSTAGSAASTGDMGGSVEERNEFSAPRTGAEWESSSTAWDLSSTAEPATAVAGDGAHAPTAAALPSTSPASRLLSATFTVERMEQVLSKAEQDAQHYCMARGVGVPADRSAMTCGVRLFAKLDHIKPHYRSSNEHNVHVALAALADELQQAAHAAIAAIPLPQREQLLEQQCQAVHTAAVDRFTGALGGHSSSPLAPVVRSRLDADVASHCSAATSANDRLIAALLGKGRVAYYRAYHDTFRAAFLSYAAAHAHAHSHTSDANSADAAPAASDDASATATTSKNSPNTFHSPTDDPHIFSHALFALLPSSTPPPPPRWLLSLHANASLLAQDAFSAAIAQGGLAWVVPGHERFDFFLFQAIQWGKQREREVGEENARRVRGYCGEMRGRLVREYRRRVGEIQPLPDNEEVVVAKARHLAALVLANYSAAVQPYLPLASVEEVRAQLQARVEEARQRLVDRNTELMAALCFEPLRDARDELNMQECDKTYHNIFISKSWWSLKCLRPGPSLFFGFRASAFAVALKHLAKAQLRFKSGALSTTPSSPPSPTAATGHTARDSPSQGEASQGESVTGAWVWDSSLVFAAWLAHGKTWPEGSIKDLRVLELGAGLGVVGLAAAALGARVLLTDGDLRVISGIRRNIAENALEGRAFAAQLEWREGLPRQVHPGEGLRRKADSGEDAQWRTSGGAELAEAEGVGGRQECEDTGACGDGGSGGVKDERERDTGRAGRGGVGVGAASADTAGAIRASVRASAKQPGAEAPVEASQESRALNGNGGEGRVAASQPLDVEEFVKDLDLIVGSDITYDVDLMPALCRTIKQLAGPRTRIFIAVELRPATPKCFHAMAAQGLTWRVVEQSELDPRWCSDDIKIFQLFS